MTCKHLLNGAPDCVFCHRDQLRGELSLAEEGLANYEEEVQAQLAITRQRDEQIKELKLSCETYVTAIQAHEADEAELRNALTACQLERDRFKGALESIGEYDCPGAIHPKHCPGCAACEANEALGSPTPQPDKP